MHTLPRLPIPRVGTMLTGSQQTGMKFWHYQHNDVLNRRNMPEKLPAGLYGSGKSYADAIRRSVALKKKYDVAVMKKENIEPKAQRAVQAYAKVIALHIYELSRRDSFLPNRKIMTDMLERDLKDIKHISIQMCNGYALEGQTKAAELIEDACKQVNAEFRQDPTEHPRLTSAPRFHPRTLLPLFTRR